MGSAMARTTSGLKRPTSKCQSTRNFITSPPVANSIELDNASRIILRQIPWGFEVRNVQPQTDGRGISAISCTTSPAQGLCVSVNPTGAATISSAQNYRKSLRDTPARLNCSPMVRTLILAIPARDRARASPNRDTAHQRPGREYYCAAEFEIL